MMAYYHDMKEFELKAIDFLRRNRLPEHRIVREGNSWPGDRKPENLPGLCRNPFVRETRSYTLAALILTDTRRQREAFRKMIEAGSTEGRALEVLQTIHGDAFSLHPKQ